MIAVIRQTVPYSLHVVALLAAALFSGLSVSQTTVNVAVVESTPVRAELGLTGNIVSTKSVAAGSEVSAQVQEIYVEVGDIVEQGQLLVQLQDQPAQLDMAIKSAQLREDEAGVALATLEEQRLYKLLKQKSISTERYDQANAHLQQAQAKYAAREAEIKRLQDTINRHQLRAPFSGLIIDKPVEKGSWANVGTVLMHVASLDSLRMELAIPQHYHPRLSRPNNELGATVHSPAQHEPTAVAIERIVPFANQQRNFQVWLAVDNSERQWLPGMSAEASLHWRDDLSYDLSVPRDAIVRNINGEATIWKIERGDKPDSWNARPVDVLTGNARNRRVAIQSSELKAGDRIVVRGNENLQPNQLIKPILLREARPN